MHPGKILRLFQDQNIYIMCNVSNVKLTKMKSHFLTTYEHCYNMDGIVWLLKISQHSNARPKFPRGQGKAKGTNAPPPLKETLYVCMYIWHAEYGILVSIPEIEYVQHNYVVLASDMCVCLCTCMHVVAWSLTHVRKLHNYWSCLKLKWKLLS